MASLASIPVIDVSDPSSSNVDIGKALVDAAETHGFVFIKNEGRDIDLGRIERQFELVSCFFFVSCYEIWVAADGARWGGGHARMDG